VINSSFHTQQRGVVCPEYHAMPASTLRHFGIASSPLLVSKGIRRCSSAQRSKFARRHNTDSSGSNVNDAVRATQKWLELVVVKQKLCPFAAPFVKDPSLVRIVESRASDPDGASRDVAVQINELMGDGRRADDDDDGDDDDSSSTSSMSASSSSSSPPKHETALIAFSHPYLMEGNFRDFVRLSWKFQEDIGDEYLGRLQLVLFHPRATHQTYSDETYGCDYRDGGQHVVFRGGETPPDFNAADYTIRSPFPTVHLLREEDVMRAVTGGYPDLESVPSRNKRKFIEQGVEVCKRRLEECLTSDD
jgi:hypothetical protein